MPDTTRTLFVDQSGEMGGAELSLLDIAKHRHTTGTGSDATILLSDGPFQERLRNAGVQAAVVPLAADVQKASGLAKQLLSGPRVLGVARNLAKRVKAYDLLYANTQKAAVVCAVAAKLSGRPMIWHLRDMLDANHFSRANRRVVVTLTNLAASVVIANSQATADAYKSAGGKVPVEVVHNGVDTAPFDQDSRVSSGNLKQSLGIATDAKLVSVFGRLTPWKGQHVLLDALETPGLEQVHAAIVGEALFTDEDRRYADELKQRSGHGSLAGRVHWLGQRDDVPSLMRQSDAIVHCSIEPEPFGRVIVEGLLAERPVIASRAGGAIEILRDETTGLLTAPGDSAELAAALHRLIDEPNFAASIATAGRSDALARFSLADRVAEINAIIARADNRR